MTVQTLSIIVPFRGGWGGPGRVGGGVGGRVGGGCWGGGMGGEGVIFRVFPSHSITSFDHPPLVCVQLWLVGEGGRGGGGGGRGWGGGGR